LANTLAGLIKMLPGQGQGSSASSAPAPNSLLAQIQQTMSAKQKSGVNSTLVQQNQLQHLLTGLLKANLTGGQSSNVLDSSRPVDIVSSLRKAAEMAQQGKLNPSSAGQFKRPHQPPATTSASKSSSHRTHHKSSSHSHGRHSGQRSSHTGHEEPIRAKVGPSASATALQESDDVPNSAVELANKERYIKKLNRQERVIEEVKLVLKPSYQRREITKDEYKEIMRKAVPKICHSKTGEINPLKVRSLVDNYIKGYKKSKKRKSGGHHGGSARASSSQRTKPAANAMDFDWLPKTDAPALKK
jgi:hypothetical protein